MMEAEVRKNETERFADDRYIAGFGDGDRSHS